MDIIWTGTDVLQYNQWKYGMGWRYRLKNRVFKLLVDIMRKYFIVKEWVISDHLNLELNSDHKVVTIPMKYPYKLRKRKHKGFNILYYFPRHSKRNETFWRYIYGYDIMLQIATHFKDRVNFIIVDGRQDMDKIYPITDFYLRPNRHDGDPVMIRECKVNNIPYYHSREVPSTDEAIEGIEAWLKSR